MTAAYDNNDATGVHGARGQVRWMWISAAVIIVDQLTKLFIANNMMLFESVPLLPFFQLTLLHNTGAAFSLLSGASGWQRWFFIALGLIAVGVIFVWLRRLPRHDRKLLGVGLALILGGALGNVIDRVAYGYVIDFIDVFYAGWHFPAFNVADSAITIGFILFILDTILSGKQSSVSK